MKNSMIFLALVALCASCGPKAESGLVGRWVEPNPINAAEVQGFDLAPDSTASSINMATLDCSAWSYSDGVLVLTLTSIGNQITTTDREAFDVLKLDADSLVLAQNGTVVWALGRQK